MRIYTRLGDQGKTRLFDGTEVKKDDPRVDAYGQVDELNSGIGAALAFLEDQETRELLLEIQKQLFALGAQLADSKFRQRASEKGHLAPEWVSALETTIDTYEEQLPPLKRFILSGGAPAGALLHLARTICRRAERAVVGLGSQSPVDPLVIQYLNRLSDLLFVLARVVNHREGMEEVEW